MGCYSLVVVGESLADEGYVSRSQMKGESEPWEIWKERALGGGNSKCKGPGVGVCLRNSEVWLAWSDMGRAAGESEIRDHVGLGRQCKDFSFWVKWAPLEGLEKRTVSI